MDIEVDPMDPTKIKILAGIGRYSSFGLIGDELNGLLLSEDGGDTWVEITDPLLVGNNISGVAVRGDTLLASSNFFFSNGGLFRSDDNGATWAEISGDPASMLPAEPIHDLVGDPTNPDRFYAAVDSTGIYRSNDAGLTWINVSVNDPTVEGFITNTVGSPFDENIEMAVSPVDGAWKLVGLEILEEERVAAAPAAASAAARPRPRSR